MGWLEAAGAAALGAAALSFVKLTVDRAGRGPGSLLGRSSCPRCGVQVFARDVLPVVGFVLLRGRCRGCAERIPRRHLLGELAMAAYWAGAAGLFGAGVLLPVVLLAPLVAVLLGSPAVRATGARGLASSVLTPAGVALLAYGLVGLLDGRWAAYGADGGLRGRGAAGRCPDSPWTAPARGARGPVTAV